MTVRELVSVGLRFFALWLLFAAFQTFEMLSSVIRTMRIEANTVGIGPVASSIGLVIALLIAAAVLLWVACRPIGFWVTKGAVSPQVVQLTPDGIVTAGCALLGLWGVKQSLIPLIEIWTAGVLNTQLSNQSFIATLSPGEKINGASQLAGLCVSLIFLCRPYQLSALVLRAGNRRPTSPTNDTSTPDAS
jgi:hypothetical protein